ncbi:hypothetical protein LSAT2_004947, partial [Lamellibrachia satsuma]
VWSASPPMFHAGLFHKLTRAGVETQTRHSLQHETHVFVCLTKTRVHEAETALDARDREKKFSVEDVEVIIQNALLVLFLAGGDRVVLPMHARCIVRALQEAQHQLFL